MLCFLCLTFSIFCNIVSKNTDLCVRYMDFQVPSRVWARQNEKVQKYSKKVQFFEKYSKKSEKWDRDFITHPINFIFVKDWRDSIKTRRRTINRKKIFSVAVWLKIPVFCRNVMVLDKNWSGIIEFCIEYPWFFTFVADLRRKFFWLRIGIRKKIKYAGKSWRRDLSISGEFSVLPQHFNSVFWTQRWGFLGFSVLATWATLPKDYCWQRVIRLELC